MHLLLPANDVKNISFGGEADAQIAGLPFQPFDDCDALTQRRRGETNPAYNVMSRHVFV